MIGESPAVFNGPAVAALPRVRGRQGQPWQAERRKGPFEMPVRASQRRCGSRVWRCPCIRKVTQCEGTWACHVRGGHGTVEVPAVSGAGLETLLARIRERADPALALARVPGMDGSDEALQIAICRRVASTFGLERVLESSDGVRPELDASRLQLRGKV